jgi:hypothetical protein
MPDEPTEEPTFIRITNQVVYAELQATRADLRALSTTMADYPEVKSRVRSLELRFYGVLAGLVAALGALGVAVARGAG